jgi:acyl phosphate:glycerol-3-phosphate acyltransferase
MNLAYALAIGYVLGSIPFGLILTHLTGAGDLRSIGSGNIGATNVLRTGKKGLAAATLLLDLLKGVVAVVLVRALWPGFEHVAAAAAFVGHCYPVWIGFRGGKGVATMAGVCLALAWPVGLVYAVIWIGLLAIVRISSVAGISAAISAPVSAILFGYPHFVPVMGGMAIILLWKHQTNVRRLLKGQEPRIGKK